MPQFSSYPPLTSFVATDLFLFWATGTGSVSTITGANLVASIKALNTSGLTTNILSANTTLDLTYQFVVGNSAGAFAILLPLGTSNADYTGRAYYFFNKGAGVVTFNVTGPDTINGAASLTFAQFTGGIIRYDGSGSWCKS